MEKKIPCIPIHWQWKNQKEMKETTPFTIATKRIKYLGISLPKETKDLCVENYKTISLDWKNQYCWNDYTIQNNLQIQCNPYQITNSIFQRTRTKKFSLYGTQKTLNSQSITEKEKTKNKKTELEESTSLTSIFTVKPQSWRKYGTGTKTEI